jgi:hypothetical protein
VKHGASHEAPGRKNKLLFYRHLWPCQTSEELHSDSNSV